jgi:hypothetical protein
MEDRRKGDRRKNDRRIEDKINKHENNMIERIRTNNAELRLIYNYLHRLKDKLTGNYE